ncbi:MAG: adenylate/guanylate cyclase domain-containing protein [Candidatus Eiseniibacteriota bacterium]
MDEKQFAALAGWLAEAGLSGLTETALVAGFCERLVAAGIGLARGTVIVDTLHPVYEGRAINWRRSGEIRMTEYGSSETGPAAESWRRSPLNHLYSSPDSMMRRRITAESGAEFPVFADFAKEGMTDYVALVSRIDAEGVIGNMDCIYSSFLSDAPGGFGDEQVALIERLAPLFALAMKSISLARIAGTLVETYLGRDAGHRVLSGRIARGVADRIEAVLWFSDLRSFTRITDRAEPEQIIPFLNDYAEAVISAIHDAGGDVLKLMGDGTLAIFTAGDRGEACRAAIAAARQTRLAVAALNERRAAADLPSTDLYLGLHVGEVFYGNVGSQSRLDFTVVGPAVNEVSRIAAMCRSVDQPVLMSSAFVKALGIDDKRFVSVGRFALRGVGQPQHLYTIDPALQASLAGAKRA